MIEIALFLKISIYNSHLKNTMNNRRQENEGDLEKNPWESG